MYLISSDVIQPFDFSDEVDGVEIQVTAGFYRNLTRQAELEEMTDPESSGPTDQAGITVVCNDRVIISADRTAVTGWGVGGASRYHPQFRAIAGLIKFTSTDARRLPVSTAKHALDTESSMYTIARNAAMDGLRLCIGFTNRWKGKEEEVDSQLSGDRVEAISVNLARSRGRKVRGSRSGAKQFIPKLPKPDANDKRRRIAFSRDEGEIGEMAVALMCGESGKPGDVGNKVWETLLKQVRKQ